MNRIRNIILSALVVIGLGTAAVALPAGAVNVFGGCSGSTDSAVCKGTASQAQPFFKTVINTLLFIVGALAVIMIIIGGLRFVLAGGDSGAVAGAKNTVLYSVIGLVVAILAFAIVNWVVDLFA